jgi:hypothetical protein
MDEFGCRLFDDFTRRPSKIKIATDKWHFYRTNLIDAIQNENDVTRFAFLHSC